MDHKRKLQKSQGPDSNSRLRIIICNLNFPQVSPAYSRNEVTLTSIAKMSLQLLMQDLQSSVRPGPQFNWDPLEDTPHGAMKKCTSAQ